jgi:hypothetical protein
MERAPWAAGLLFGLSLAIVVTIAGPLLLFNPPFVWALQDRHHVAEVGFDGRHDAVDAVTLSTLVDIWTDGSFAAELQPGEPLLNERERSHMHDVAVLVRILLGVLVMALVIGGMAIVLAGIFAVAFEPAFLVFHELFFPPGTYLFEPGSKLITLFPEAFWFDAALAAGATIVIAAVLITLIGFRLWRRGAPPASA